MRQAAEQPGRRAGRAAGVHRARPLLPWLVSESWTARGWSLGLGTVAALAIGSVLGRLSGRSVLWAALRQLLVVGIATFATVAVGRLFKVPVS